MVVKAPDIRLGKLKLHNTKYYDFQIVEDIEVDLDECYHSLRDVLGEN